MTWSDSTIKIFVDDIQTREVTLEAGRVTEKILRAYVCGSVSVSHLDRITYQGEVYEVTSIPTIEYLLGSAVYQKLELTRRTD